MPSEASAQTMEFQTEVSQLMKLLVHSLYSNKEIFLRELISNASDASDKLRFEAVSNEGLYEGQSEIKISVSFDKEQGTITVTDNGIGMNKDEVIANIGTIASSGTKRFLESLTGDQAKDSHLIGQFGVGFYSAFVVADKVTLTSRRAGDDPANGIQWESNGQDGFTLTPVERAERGTEIVLHLNEDGKEFADGWRLRSIIKKYSDHITFPIEMEKEADASGEEEAADAEESKEIEFETINSASAMWTRPKSDILADEYKDFYKQICFDFEDPLAWTHNRVEGKYEYTSLLYIPGRAPFDLYDQDQKAGIKLYVKRVFVMDDTDKLMPRYLRFVRGLIDSNDLPLNVSREILQSNRVIDSMRNASVKKVLGMLESMSKKQPEEYKKVWSEFGQVLKEGPAEDFANKEQIAKLFRFASTKGEGEEQVVSLTDYLDRMKSGQDKIYYITAENYSTAKNSPHLEFFNKQDIEVLLMHDRVDEWLMSHLNEFEGKSFSSIAKGDLDLEKLGGEKEAEARKDIEKGAEGLLKSIKDVLGDKVDEVKVSHRLVSSPACLVLQENEMAMYMQQMLKKAGQDVPTSKPKFEVNLEHPILKRLENEVDDDQFKDWVNLLFDQSILAEGGQLEDAAGFVHRLNDMLLTFAK